MSTTGVGTNNDKISMIRRQLRTLYENYFTDNKQVVSYLANIQELDTGNFFDKTSKRILSLKIPYATYASGNKDYLFLNNDLDVKTDELNKYRKLLTTIMLVASALKHIVMQQNFDSTHYTGITSIDISTDASTGTDTEEYYNGQSIKYARSGILKITCNNVSGANGVNTNDIISGSITLSGLKHNSSSFIDENDVLKNYIYFMLNAKGQNIKRQTLAFYYFIKVLNESFLFYSRSEQLIGLTNPDTTGMCKIFNPYYENTTSPKLATGNYYYYLAELRKFNNFFMTYSAGALTYTNTGTIKSVCPLVIDFSNSGGVDNTDKPAVTDTNGTTQVAVPGNDKLTHNDAQKGLVSADTHEVKISYIDGTTKKPGESTTRKSSDTNAYKIKDIHYIYDATSKRNNQLSNVTLYAKKIAVNATTKEDIDKLELENATCGDEYEPIDDFTDSSIGKKVQVIFEVKNDLSKNFYNSGAELTNHNESILDSNDKINAQVKNYQLQKDSLKAIDTRTYIYYVIFGIIGLVVLAVMLLDMQQSMKLYISAIIAVVLLIMCIVNYSLNYNVIESFDANTRLQGCSNINSSATFQQRVTFINEKIPDFTKEIVAVLDNLGYYISKVDSVDMQEKLGKSLNNEKRAFQDQSEIYKYKQETNTKSIDIMKLDMIKKTGFINLLTINFFVLALVLIFYMAEPSYLNVYLGLAIILIILNTLVYYYVVLHPVRTKAKNKYWPKPGKSLIQDMD
jgi:hypothetical protein